MNSFGLRIVTEPWTSSYAAIANPELKARRRGTMPKNIHRQNRLGAIFVLMLIDYVPSGECGTGVVN